ncbi:TetR/AcrR family transcriptional regulator [Rhodococcus sp. BP-349]|uniref:TetR/AcrR family transcriptional regulator n=1 Tax=unclassified Rhodococcus (in: high G+C Gram-positive bacteria) TaxID=192944 RepID=UPI001C9A808E|nr:MULTISPECIES: TetR/AcrR family transcriptional regulator [unclassified Rhodococcus (in: high G+C Gram-positive bacteria)]MBY6537910.1 TetR/AcrR family transcriptional regulator [Rhodococcus sp. BP-363]MBY6542247.1 TetR/AcrR family transcriptional regulator [Rhodococcus sp. BP-369]MBY6561477.1 TetR/AcrR family transcriptional regulator [Rhodococcus sp. BP-370]MBY6575769.1 TetR/AcrR family transcriptional regulator [Rhodococcus sp. BP-364]MBY6585070.1 TetR/AcrR family transcriptional regulato
MDLQRVQRAGVVLFSRQGFAATGIRELGAEAGINSATLYHYVGSKESLLASIIRTCLDEMTRSGALALRRSSDPAVQLAGLVSSHVGFTAVNSSTARVAEYEMRGLTGSNLDEMQKMRDDYEALFGHVLERGGRIGLFDVADHALSRLAILEMCTGVAHWYRPGGRLDLLDIQKYFVSAVFRVIAADTDVLEGFDFRDEEVTRLASEPLGDHGSDAGNRL